ncbi:helix-turn-helix domain-containing protein [Actinomycetospora flava]|uniref:XRE family transcriptional regulator n=1 Tax=Actinomycetospora flava TaxID=3129232 RepID=A0ABU8MC18_9PSEU
MTALGEVILTLRRARGLTQVELAARAGVTQAALSRYEQDLRHPDDETLEALAAALGVTQRFLSTAGRERGAMAIDAHMRRRATAKATDWRMLEARLNELRFHARQLFEEVSLRSSDLVPTFDPLETTPSDAARMVRMQWKLPSGPVRRLLAWLEAAGCLVVQEPFPTRRVDGLSQWIGDHPVLLLNSSAPLDRLRLTAAHELGHLCLHANGPGDDVEREANEFAAEFLMPAAVIESQLRHLSIGDLMDLKRQWGVSVQALIERAHALGTLRPADRTSLYKQLSAKGWRTREPGSDEIAPEETRLTTAIADSLHQRGLDDDEVALVAGFASADTNHVFVGSHVRPLRAL